MQTNSLEWLSRFEGLLESAPRDDPDLLSQFYTPDARLEQHLLQLKSYAEKTSPTAGERRGAGILMEQIAFLAFSSLTPALEPESYRSVGSQVDLEVSGVGTVWRALLSTLGLQTDRHSFLLEAKATKDKVDVPVMTRLCALMDQRSTVTLGIFFTLSGCTGEPTRNESTASLRDARFHQVLHHVRTSCPIVVFDLDDILSLSGAGSLIRHLHQKIRQVEQVTTSQPVRVGEYKKVELPGHLSELMSPTRAEE